MEMTAKPPVVCVNLYLKLTFPSKQNQFSVSRWTEISRYKF